MSSHERRNTVRRLTWFPVQLESGGDNVVAAARDISEHGMLIATHKRIGAGKAVKLALHLDPGVQKPHQLEARVVRTLRSKGDPAAPWSYKLAVEFEAPKPELVASMLDDA